MGIYDRQIASVKRKIAEKGCSVVWSSVNKVANEQQPWKASTASTSHFASLLFVTSNDKTLSFFAKEEIVKERRYALMGAYDFTPTIGDLVELPDGTVLVVDFVDMFAPNNEPILYVIGFNK